ncbi:MAG: SMP-30/gluconolactonase/LRE family protein [Alphaproteobacteria bacterium]
MNEVVVVLEARAGLGEGPVWCPREQALYWVDSYEPALKRLDPASGALESWPMPSLVGSLALRESGGAVVALRHGFAFVDLASGAVEPVHDPEAHMPETRFNDGKCDRRGRFWAGTMHFGGQPRYPIGSLYRLDPDRSCHRMEGGIRTSNGIGWSPDDRTMYFTDTRVGRIYAYDFDLATGSIRDRRVFTQVPLSEGMPDGLTIDSQGFVWSVHYDGWRVSRYAPDGSLDRVIGLPVQRPTSCTFGGADLRTLYLTSARDGISYDLLERQPLAGALFALDVGVAGLPEPRFAG